MDTRIGIFGTPLPPLPATAYPPDAVELPRPRPLVEQRPRFETIHGDDVAFGFDNALREAHRRATERGRRQVVTRCYDDATRIAHPPLARAWCIQDWR